MSATVVELRPGPRAAAVTAAVDEAICTHASSLAVVHHEHGPDAARHHATGMHMAALAMIRSMLGCEGVERVLDAAKAENRRLQERDDRKPGAPS